MSDARGILAAAVSLLLTAMGWAAVRGEEAPLAWLLAGAGSITLGVWLGVVVAGPPLLMGEDRGRSDEGRIDATIVIVGLLILIAVVAVVVW